VPIAQADPATLLETALHLREAKPALFAGALGVLIVKVVPGSQAAEKGLQLGDIVIAYAGEAMNSAEQLIEAVQAKASESQVVLRVIRGEKVEEVGVRGRKVGVELKNILSKEATNLLEQLKAAIRAKNHEKVIQLIQDNPKIAEKILPVDSLETVKQLHSELELIRLQKEGKKEATNLLEQLQAAIRAKNHEKVIQLIQDNPKIAEKILPVDSLETVKQLHSELELIRLQKEGEEAYYHSNYLLALEKWQAGLDKALELADKHYTSMFLSDLGVVYNGLGEYTKALKYHRQASIIDDKELDDKGGKGIDLGNIGVIYWHLGQYDEALKVYQQSLAIAKELGYKEGEGDNLTNLGLIYFDLGQYPKALQYYQQALTIHRKIDDERGKGIDLGNIGGVYLKLGQHDKARQYYQQSLDTHRKLDYKLGEGIELINLGGVYSDLGQYFETLDYYRQALAMFSKIGNKYYISQLLNNIGLVYWKSGQYPEAKENYQQALAIAKEIRDKSVEGIGLTNLGVLYQNLGQYDQAKTHFKDSLTIFESLKSLDDLWKAQGGLAYTEVHLNQPQDAIHHLEQALDIIEQLRASLTGDIEKATGLPARTLKTDFMQNKFVVYDRLISLYHDQGDDQKAFETFERKQGRAFLEDMAKSGVRRYVDLPVEISQKEATLETQLEAARKILGEAAGKGDEAVKQARELLATAETALEVFKAELKVKYPRYYNLKYPQPVKLPDLQQKVLQEGELLLIYNVREEATDLWLVGKQHFQMFSLSVTEAQVKEKVETFRKWGIDRVDTENSQALADSLEKDFTDFTQASHALYQQLFPATLLGEAKPKRLYIVPTSALYELPFEALVTENTDKPHYLLQDYAISYLSSASLLKTLRDAKQQQGTAQRKPLLAFADPVYPTQDCQPTDDSLLAQQVRDYYALLTGGGLDEKSGCPKKLPSVAQSIIQSLGLKKDFESSTLIKGDDASRYTVLKMNREGRLENSKYVMFSTHGLVPNKITPLIQPALLLSHTTPLEQEKDEDGEMVLKGFLTMGDVFGLSLNTDLVILSACNTGRGETIKGEGTIGLTRAFMYAGTPAVSITLWSIEAGAAKKLNVAWFNRLKDGQPLADSLREAKLEMLDKSGYYRYPYAWAGVVVFGDGK
jgi:tetratricopeptide (TPR) repeat protein